jgi:HK97 family phage major capsid protein
MALPAGTTGTGLFGASPYYPDDSGIGYLSHEESLPIFQRAVHTSVVQRLARQQPLGRRGSAIPIFGKAVATWTGGELKRKKVTDLSKAVKTMMPHKIAAVFVLSEEVFQLNPAGFAEQVRIQAGDAIGRAFDNAVLFGLDSPFPDSLSDTDKSVTLNTATAAAGGIRADFIAGMKALVDDGKRLTGFALDDSVEPDLLGAVSTQGVPIWQQLEVSDLPAEEALGAARRSTLLARPAWMQVDTRSPAVSGVSTVGIGGDWTRVVWGVIGGIRFKVSTEATVVVSDSVTVNLWQDNGVGVLAEAEYGYVCADVDSFVKYRQ